MITAKGSLLDVVVIWLDAARDCWAGSRLAVRDGVGLLGLAVHVPLDEVKMD